jgi:hypothetical protein
LAYAYCYFIIPKDISILQTSIRDFDFNLLHKRQPLVIEDIIPNDITTILNSWFSPNIICNIETNGLGSDGRSWNINTYKYLFIYAQTDTELLLYKSGHKVLNDIPDINEPIIAIKMKAYQSVIVPYRWHYNIKIKNDCFLYGIHDYVTYVVDLLI